MKLRYYIARRALLVIPTLIGLTLIVFALTHVGGTQRLLGSYINTHSAVPIAVQEQELSARFHFNDPLVVQYYYWLIAFIQGDWGFTQTQIFSGRVTDAIALFLPNTLVLTALASVLSTMIAIPLGVWSAVRKDSLFDQATRVVSFAGYSIPVYWLGLILLITFASSSISPYLNIFPLRGHGQH